MSPQSDMDVDPQLARFWDETRLRANFVPAMAVTVAAAPVIQESWLAVSEVLALGYGERSGAVITKGKTVMRARTTPSAGALYPFELLVAFRGATHYELYDYDVLGCCLQHVGQVETAALAALSSPQDDGAAAEPPPDAVVAVVGRPWASMRKYGRRGYLYTHLDGAHAATNIALAAEEMGFSPVTRLRFDRHRAAELLGLLGRCREPQTLITLTAPAVRPPVWGRTVANPFAVPIWRHVDGAPPEDPDEAEVAAWRSVRSISAFHHEEIPRSYGSPRSVAAGGAEAVSSPVPLPGGGGEPPASRGFRDTVLDRRSAKGFRPEAVPGEDLGRVLARLREGGVIDSADGPRAALRVLARAVDGIGAGAYGYDGEAHALRPVSGEVHADDAVVTACMSQEVVRGAAALLVLHSSMGPLLGARGRQGLAELHYHAASAAQRLCLGATEHGVGITCLGGFDASRVAQLVRLDASEEVIYVLACGVPDENAVKWDRAPIAYSHGRGPGQLP
ncbi:nitroreductase family protein [Streptomyces profundus]|uniref:nitroreductase family protein n=1 Tax=Streptomyces profundus TaxID=2867410 RepID=UPI001D16370E|nr:nitroreductase family protein [Streptomyces sp. MA3_2.13]UED83200.1 nitroreductase family protein [Streptomyces sp. MA3_2.13]